MTRTADLLIRAIVEAGIDTFFGIPGVDTLPIYEALEAHDVRSFVVRHEATAAYAADAYFRATGRPAACLTTGGPGAANTAAATGEAWASSSTFLHITTTVPAAIAADPPPRGMPHFHPRQLDQFEATTSWRGRLEDRRETEATAAAAMDRLTRPPYAPVLLDVPVDVLEATVDDVAQHAPSDALPSLESSELELDAVVAALGGAVKPVLWAGTGSLGAADALIELAEKLDAPVVMSHSAKRRFPHVGHPLVVAYPPHEPAVADLLADSDVLLAIGSDVDAMMTRQGRVILPATIIQVDVERAHTGLLYPVDHVLIGRAESIVPALVDSLEGRANLERTDGRAELARTRTWDDQAEGGFAPARRFLSRLDAALPGDARVVCDMAVAGYWAAGYLRLAPARQLLYPMGWGTLGFGLPAAVGSGAVDDGRRTICIAGDGGLMYAIGELATIAEHGMPISIVVVDDGGYGMLRFAGRARFDRDFDMNLRSPDLQAVADAFGIRATTIDLEDGGLQAALASTVDGTDPSVLVVRGSLEPPRMSRLWE